MVPVLKYLMEKCMETEIIHDELEEANSEWKNTHKNTTNNIKDLREKMAAEKKTLTEQIEANEKNADMVTELKKKVRYIYPRHCECL